MNTERKSKRKYRVVYDTNVYISALVYGGSPWDCLQLAINGKVELIISKELLVEFANVLERKFDWAKEKTELAIRRIIQIAIVVEPKKRLSVIRSDSTDNRVLEAAEKGSADFIVSGDKKHILPLKKFKGIKIVSPGEFVRYFK